MSRPNRRVFLSFIICTMGRCPELNRCLCSIFEQKEGIDDCEIIVVDQSEQHFVRQICSNDQRIIYIASSQRGLSHNRNIALSVAMGKWISFIDDDAWLDENYVFNLKHAIEERFRGSILVIDALRSDSKTFYVNRFNLKKVKENLKISRSLLYSVCSISIVFSKKVFDIIGGFDPDFGVGSTYPSCEETDLLLRAWYAKINVFYLSGIKVYHPPSIVEYNRSRAKKAFVRAQGHGALYRKHLRDKDASISYLTFKLLQSIVGSFVQSILHICSPHRASFHLLVFLGKIKGFLCYKNG